MAKPKGKKPSNVGNATGRAAAKAPKKNPKPNGIGKTGRTVGGYSPAKLEERALKRQLARVAK